MRYYREKIEQEIENKNNSFEFRAYKYPLLEIYASAIFSYIDEGKKINPTQENAYESIIIHVIPQEEELIILVGYLKDNSTQWEVDYANSWEDLTETQLELKLTTLFINHIENWGMSPLIYDDMNKKIRDQLIQKSHDSANQVIYDDSVFNMFEINGT